MTVTPIVRRVNSMCIIGAITKGSFIGSPNLRHALLKSNLTYFFTKLMNNPPMAACSRMANTVSLAGVAGPRMVQVTTFSTVLFSIVNGVDTLLGSVPDTILNKVVLLLFNAVTYTNVTGLMGGYVSLDHAEGVVVMSLALAINVNKTIFA